LTFIKERWRNIGRDFLRLVDFQTARKIEIKAA